MSLQSDFQSTRVVILSAPEDEHVANYLDDQLGERGKKVARIELSDYDETHSLTTSITGADYEFVIVVIGSNTRNLRSVLRSVATRAKHLIGVMVDDILPDFFEEIPAFHREHVIDFSNANLWEQQIEVLNDRINWLVVNYIEDTNKPQNFPPGTVSLTLTSDNGRAEATYVVSTAVIHLLLAAKHIKTVTANDSSGPEVEFTFLLAAFCAQVDTRFARWFWNLIDRMDLVISGLDRVAEAEQYATKEMQRVTDARYSFFASTSVRGLFSAAALMVVGGVIDVHPIIAACVYQPEGHEYRYLEWKIDRKAWSLSFLGYIQRFHHDVFELYSSEHARAFSETPVPDMQDNPVGDIGAGPSTHITSDIWTTEDELDYRPYAYAIARFLTHPRTAAPLTISIQAPWGGGKTSLMRMIQRELDAPATQPSIVSKEASGEPNTLCIKVRDVLREIEKKLAPNTRKEVPREPNALHMKVRDVLREIEKKLAPNTVAAEPDRPDRDKRNESRFEIPPKSGNTKETVQPKMTVWFNVWKYESVDQVWAGLVDAILRQVTERMTPFEREKFWLQLTFKRVDADKIRQKVYKRIFSYTWRAVVNWKFVLAVGAIAASIVLDSLSFLTGSLTVGGAFIAVAIRAYWKVLNEPATASLREYVSAPDYRAKLGFVHYAETDFRKLLACIPEQYKPLVIFIDDLDRCSPLRVAQVMEAINLFLAGEFPDCMFVLGMDSEMVAAALQAAHSEVINHLPSDASIPVGWRFMEKFIQLPFIIPPSGTTNIRRYTASLFAEKKQEPDAAVNQKVGEILLAQSSGGYREDDIRREMRQSGLNDGQAEQVVAQVRVQTALKKIDEGIKNFNDNETQIEIETLLGREMEIFRGNPRDLKRFVNTFRFHYFLWWAQSARMSRESEAASLEQVVRWTAFSIRWPEVVRWLWRGSDTHRQGTEGSGQSEKRTASRMKQLEDTCLDPDGSGQWEQAIRQTVFPGSDKNETDKDVHWLHDRELYSFLRREIDRNEGERLSSAVGKGLW